MSSPARPRTPGGPHIRAAAARFQVPERWIRAVMRQESGGRLYDAGGRPITSPVGAMGLMQVMPRTYDTLAAQHGLVRTLPAARQHPRRRRLYPRMHDRFGAPAFLAAYNAGPERTAAWLAGSMILPEETENYLASVGSRLWHGGGGGRAPSPPMPSGAATPGLSAGIRARGRLRICRGGMTAVDYSTLRARLPRWLPRSRTTRPSGRSRAAGWSLRRGTDRHPHGTCTPHREIGQIGTPPISLRPLGAWRRARWTVVPWRRLEGLHDASCGVKLRIRAPIPGS